MRIIRAATPKQAKVVCALVPPLSDHDAKQVHFKVDAMLARLRDGSYCHEDVSGDGCCLFHASAHAYKHMRTGRVPPQPMDHKDGMHLRTEVGEVYGEVLADLREFGGTTSLPGLIALMDMLESHGQLCSNFADPHYDRQVHFWRTHPHSDSCWGTSETAKLIGALLGVNVLIVEAHKVPDGAGPTDFRYPPNHGKLSDGYRYVPLDRDLHFNRLFQLYDPAKPDIYLVWLHQQHWQWARPCRPGEAAHSSIC